ncbi:hypothetical protein BJ165DRAFT_1534777 [Panaeolus papilionaceus]|nr:hypothetical protein BJ165DRAFT_1534777 [Panaeolus papilionaceus]
MFKNHSLQLNSRAQTFVDKLFHYRYASEKARVPIRKTFNTTFQSENRCSKIPYDIAYQRWNELCVYTRTTPPIYIIVGSPEWKETWTLIDSILEMQPTRIYFLQVIAGNYASYLVTSFELKDSNPHKATIMSVVDARMYACLEELEAPGAVDFDPEFINKAMQRDLAKLITRQLHSVDKEGCPFEFVIKDYGTSYVNGPWVEYRLLHDGKEYPGDEGIKIIAGQIDELLKKAKVVSDT